MTVHPKRGITKRMTRIFITNCELIKECDACRTGYKIKDMNEVEIHDGSGYFYKIETYYLCDVCYNRLIKMEVENITKEFRDSMEDFVKKIGAFVND